MLQSTRGENQNEQAPAWVETIRGLEDKRRDHLAERFDRHKITAEPESKSWRLKDPKLGVFDSYTITWTPGFLVMSGDLFELVVTHHHALKTLQSSIGWVKSASYDYFMSKTNVRTAFDLDTTIETIIEDAIREAEEEEDLRSMQALKNFAQPFWSDTTVKMKVWWKRIGIEFEKRMSGQPDHVLQEFMSNHLNYDDFYGDEKYPTITGVQYAAIKRWAELVS